MATKKSDEPKSKDKEKVFDVAKPGESAADATARPVIVGHGSTLKSDPMVKPDDAKAPDMEEETPSAPVLTTEKKVIQPISDDLSADKKSKEEDQQPSAEPETKPQDSANDEEVDEPSKDEQDSEKNEEIVADSSEAGAVDALAQEVSSKKEAVKADEAAKKKQAEIDKLIAEKKYIVPIGEEAHKKPHQTLYFFIILLIVLLVVVNFLVDAGMVDIGIQPLTDLL